MHRALVSIIVPVFNEAGTVASVIDRLLTIEFSAPREIIVVNDGSTDGTRAALDNLPENPFLHIVHADRNHGKGHAVRLGFARACGTVIAIQDADLELDPAQLPDLVGPVLRGEAEAIYGSRFLQPTTAPFMTIAGNKALTMLTNLLFGSSLTDMETCYKVMRGDIARSLALSANRFDIEPEITARLLLGGHRIVERPVRFDARSRMGWPWPVPSGARTSPAGRTRTVT
ncbi:MAG: glycosyltransferase family 2 protein [Acidobacteria bacterium]|nr:glycosyltransferase family 2 protein [Acidobacteriota bacterium]